MKVFGLGLIVQLLSMTIMYLTASAPISWRGFDDMSLFTLVVIITMLIGLLIQTGFDGATNFRAFHPATGRMGRKEFWLSPLAIFFDAKRN